MTVNSLYGYVVGGLVEAEGHVMRAGYPVATNHARYVVNNAQHLFDESTQYRVNWVCTPGKEIVSTIYNTAFTHVTSFTFPVSRGNQGIYPEGLVVRIGGFISATATIIATLVPAMRAESQKDLVDTIANMSESCVSDLPVWIIQEELSVQYDAQTPNIYSLSSITSPTFEEPDGNKYTSTFPMLRLSIWAISSVGESTFSLCGVSVREFRIT